MINFGGCISEIRRFCAAVQKRVLDGVVDREVEKGEWGGGGGGAHIQPDIYPDNMWSSLCVKLVCKLNIAYETTLYTYVHIHVCVVCVYSMTGFV